MSASVFEIFDFGIIIKMAISVRSNREEVSIGWSIMQVSGDTGWELVCSRCYGDQLSQIVISVYEAGCHDHHILERYLSYYYAHCDVN